jgi:ABC-type nitrate/sulfonate/bicarbonate transport system substrate-binding protein
MNWKCPGFLVQRLFIAMTFIGACFFPLSSSVHAAQKELQKLTVGYTPIAGASLPFFIAVEEKIFQKYGYEISRYSWAARR